jgi:hypothetical protein
VIKFVSDLRQVGGFLRVLWFPPSIKLTTKICDEDSGAESEEEEEETDKHVHKTIEVNNNRHKYLNGNFIKQ